MLFVWNSNNGDIWIGCFKNQFSKTCKFFYIFQDKKRCLFFLLFLTQKHMFPKNKILKQKQRITIKRPLNHSLDLATWSSDKSLDYPTFFSFALVSCCHPWLELGSLENPICLRKFTYSSTLASLRIIYFYIVAPRKIFWLRLSCNLLPNL